MPRFLVVTDTPAIKQFVFGTDALAEVRGASSLLDRLNRHQTTRLLREGLPSGALCDPVFTNGGTGQFIIEAPNRDSVENALSGLARFYGEETSNDVRIVWGLANYPEARHYKEAASEAHVQLRTFRETAFRLPCSPLMPFLVECSSASHLPSRTRPVYWGGESLMLSDAARRKRQASRQARTHGPWDDWLEHLAQINRSTWPDDWTHLRAKDAVELAAARRGPAPARKGYVALVYADGNAMGRLVQELDSRETCAIFSEIVDGSIREACYLALDAVCAAEIASQRSDPTRPSPLPADILLLGGDDLLVLLPADFGLNFALLVTENFETITRAKIQDLPPGKPRDFFAQKLQGRGMTISCGVALAQAKYPFYLLLDLAEELLRGAKQGGSRDPARQPYSAPAYIDFHLAVGSTGTDLEAVRKDEYLVGGTDSPQRTLRPYSRDRLRLLQQAVGRLKQARVPHSKLQGLLDAALDPRPMRAEMIARELFGRLRKDDSRNERQALWDALGDLGTDHDFPWCRYDGKPATALADLVEAFDFFPREDHP